MDGCDGKARGPQASSIILEPLGFDEYNLGKNEDDQHDLRE
jgi:hypothetical protein